MLKFLVILFIIKLYACINFCKLLNAALCSNLTKACNFCFFEIKTFLFLPTQKIWVEFELRDWVGYPTIFIFYILSSIFYQKLKNDWEIFLTNLISSNLSYFRSSRPEMPRRKHLCQSLFLIKLQACYFIKKETLAQVPQACNFIEKETLAQVFSWEFCEISKGGLIRWNFSFTGG